MSTRRPVRLELTPTEADALYQLASGACEDQRCFTRRQHAAVERALDKMALARTVAR